MAQSSISAAPLPEYEVYAVRYGSQPRSRRGNFLHADSHDGPMPMDYYVWLIRGAGQVILVDTGFSAEAAAKRQRGWRRCPIGALAVLGVQPEDVQHVVLTHLHYDHAGNLDKLPNATFHVQAEEMHYATGPCMCNALTRFAYSPEDVAQLVHHLYKDRVEFHEGDDALQPGIELMHLGGHTRGLQAVRVHTQRGWITLASDAMHFYENAERLNPFPIVHNVDNAIAAIRRVRRLAGSPDFIVPGHDPLVMQVFQRLPGDDEGIACIHVRPTSAKEECPSNDANSSST